MTGTDIDIRPVAGALGAEIGGVDLSRPLSDGEFGTIRRALLDHQVIFFRDQNLSPHGLRDFAARFGPCNRYPFLAGIDDCPEVIEIVKEPGDSVNFGGLWHSDTTYLPRPPLATLLHALEVPPYGGDTLFASARLAFESLSEAMKTALEGLRALSSAGRRYGATGRPPGGEDLVLEAWHPVLRTHPETGRKAVFVNGAHTTRFEGWTEAESRPWIDHLCERVVRPEFTCRFHWRPGSLAVWDNRCTQHFALNDYHGFRRRMHRCTVEGDEPR